MNHILALYLFGIISLHPFVNPEVETGFDFTRHSIPLSTIVSGGPGKDEIPAILRPEFITAPQADTFLKDSERLLALEVNGVAKAYPLLLMRWHEVVNDSFGDERVVITYCPLCGTGMAFDAKLDGKGYSFGVSGLLYYSDLLFYDYETESLWSQIDLEAITGEMMGKKLKQVPLVHTSWGSWKKKHPGTLVLAPDPLMEKLYQHNPYKDYQKASWLMFPLPRTDDSYHPKEFVIGVKLNGVAKAYPFSELKKGPETFTDSVGGEKVTVTFDMKSSTAHITDAKGNPINSVVGFWFAWYVFNSDTLVYTTR